MSEKLSHYDDAGHAHMVDVSAKAATRREAVAEAFVALSEAVLAALPNNPKGNPLEVARFAGIQAAKQTASLIPLCHPIRIDGVQVDVVVRPHRFEVSAVTEIVERTGVEMEALTACAMAALTLVKALADLDPTASIEDLTLWHKSGGRSGDWERRGPDGRMAHDPS